MPNLITQILKMLTRETGLVVAWLTNKGTQYLNQLNKS